MDITSNIMNGATKKRRLELLGEQHKTFDMASRDKPKFEKKFAGHDQKAK